MRAGRVPLSGHEGVGTIVISYHFPSGRQGPRHPHPGHPYSGTSRTAYLPDTPQGRRALRLLHKAFRCRVTFTVGALFVHTLTHTRARSCRDPLVLTHP